MLEYKVVVSSFVQSMSGGVCESRRFGEMRVWLRTFVMGQPTLVSMHLGRSAT